MNITSPAERKPPGPADQAPRAAGNGAPRSAPDIAPEKISEFCPIYASLFDMLSRRWMGIVLRVLMSGPHRFSEILAAVPGLSDPLLTQRLRELEAKKIVERHVFPTSPVRVEYQLTEAGRDLENAVRVLSRWAEKWIKVPEPGTENPN
jgi:DNA-binding HxlR family transcriptional regulator